MKRESAQNDRDGGEEMVYRTYMRGRIPRKKGRKGERKTGRKD
jgi:hypothetical protein